MESQKIQISIGSKKYVLTTDEEPEMIRRAAALADRTLRETASAARLQESQAAVMALLNLSNELIRSRDENARLRRDLNAANERLADK